MLIPFSFDIISLGFLMRPFALTIMLPAVVFQTVPAKQKRLTFATSNLATGSERYRIVEARVLIDRSTRIARSPVPLS